MTEKVFGSGAHDRDHRHGRDLAVCAAQYGPAADAHSLFRAGRPPRTWFALMASFMNLALVAGQLQTKYLNDLYPVARGNMASLVF